MQELLQEVYESLPSDEEERILRWRFDQFLSLGFDLVAGALMADSKVDLGLARRLVAQGCPLETASRILL